MPLLGKNIFVAYLWYGLYTNQLTNWFVDRNCQQRLFTGEANKRDEPSCDNNNNTDDSNNNNNNNIRIFKLDKHFNYLKLL